MHIVIIGNGIAGITAARHIRKISDHRITVISGETDYFFSRTALMYVFMGQLRFEDLKPYEDWFWEKNRIELVNGWVEKIDTPNSKLLFDDNREISYDKLLIATGGKSKKAGWPGQELDGVQGLYSVQDMEAMEHYSLGLKRAVIVGGGLIGIEIAEMLHSRHIPITFLVREKNYWDVTLPLEEAQMINRHIREQGIDLRLETELKEIWGDTRTGRVKAVVTNKSEKIECGFVGLTIGVNPNIDFLHLGEIELGQGVLVNEFLETNVPNVYAAGDCVQLRNPPPGRKAVEAVWYTSRMMGEVAAHNIVHSEPANHSGSVRSKKFKVPYDPGLWYNSAKFFNIAYQVYGDIRPQLPENHATLYWEHPKGQMSLRINWDKNTEAVIGFNLMGIRYRQEVCEKWIREKTPIEEVLKHLGLANFDPEFFKQYEGEMITAYNRQTGRNLQLKQRRSLNAVLHFLK